MKIVKENINEFKKGLDPVDSLGLGRRKLIEDWLQKMSIEEYIINDDYTIDIEHRLILSNKQMGNFPEFIQFRSVIGDVSFQNNKLTSLRGSPIFVSGMFSCSDNELKTLEYAPKVVKFHFFCHSNLKQFTKEDVKDVCDVHGLIVVKP